MDYYVILITIITLNKKDDINNMIKKTKVKQSLHLCKIIVFCIFILNSFAFANNIFPTKSQKILSADQAFSLNYEQKQNKLYVYFQIAPDHYLYKDKIQFAGSGVAFDNIVYPLATNYHDDFFGDILVYKHDFEIALDLTKVAEINQLNIDYQGCRDGFCYPPQQQQISLQPLSLPQSKTNSTATDLGQNSLKNNEAPISEKTEKSVAAKSNSSSISVIGLLGFLLIGVGLAFTPCVLPMVPLISAIVLGNNKIGGLRAFWLSVVYVQGMALSYAALGLLVVFIGLPLQIALQSPIVLIIISLLFIALAASMFGLFDVKMPNFLQQKLHNLEQKQQGGSFKGVFFMGVIAGLVSSPCISAPLASSLLYIMQSGDYLKGGLSLLLMAEGIGLPLILVTIFGKQIIPKSQQWTTLVKTAFGFVILAVPIFLLNRFIPIVWQDKLWALLAVSFLLWMILNLGKFKGVKIISIALILLLSFFAQPLFKWSETKPQHANVSFNQIHSYQDLTDNIANLAPNKLIMLDLRADWCVACLEFEHKTFNQKIIIDEFKNFKLLQMDFSKNTAEVKNISEKLQILGLPSILFFNHQGEISNSRVQGFLDAAEFSQWLQNVQLAEKN